MSLTIELDKINVSRLNLILKWKGKTHSFMRYGLDKYKQPDEDNPILTTEVLGIFHQSTSYVSLSTTEAVSIKSKPQPAILVGLEDSNKVAMGDILILNGNKYKVTGEVNLEVASDICLEVAV